MTVARQRQGERGAALVEAALVVPLVVLFVLAGVDVGMLVFQSTQASAAAREGARAGILRYTYADVPTSADAASIRQAVERRLGRRSAEEPITVTVHCVGPSGTVPLASGCAGASILDRDRLDVAVSWEHRALSFATAGFGSARTVTGRSTMVLLGRPSGVQ